MLGFYSTIPEVFSHLHNNVLTYELFKFDIDTYHQKSLSFMYLPKQDNYKNPQIYVLK